jgi:hypothetical protein
MGLGSEIRDPEKTYFGSRIQGSKKAPDPGAGSATLEITSLEPYPAQASYLWCTHRIC